MKNLLVIFFAALLLSQASPAEAAGANSGGGFLDWLGFGDNDKDEDDAGDDSEDAEEEDSFYTGPRDLLPVGEHGPLEGGWIVEYGDTPPNEEKLARVVLSRGITHACWDGDGGCWSEYRRDPKGGWKMAFVGLQYSEDDQESWNPADPTVVLENNVLRVSHDYDVIRESNYLARERIKLGPLYSGHLVGDWEHTAPYMREISGKSVWQKADIRIGQLEFRSRLKDRSFQSSFSHNPTETAENQELPVATVNYNKYWWDPNERHSRGNAPSFWIFVHGDNLWAHRYAWMARDTGLELEPAYRCADGTAWRWWDGFGYCEREGSTLTAIRLKVNVWGDATPGIKELIVDGKTYPFRLKIDGYPDEAPLTAALEFRDPDNAQLDELTIGEPFFVTARVENAAGNDIIPVQLTWGGDKAGNSQLILRPTGIAGQYRSSTPIVLVADTSLPQVDGSGPAPALTIPEDMTGKYRMTLSRFEGEHDLVADIVLAGGQEELTFDAKVGDQTLLVKAEVTRAKHYAPGTGSYRAALELKVRELSGPATGQETAPRAPIDATDLAHRDATIVSVGTDVMTVTARFADSAADMPVVSEEPVEDVDPMPGNLTTINLFSREDLEVYDGGWETRTDNRDYVSNNDAALTAICRVTLITNCVELPSPQTETAELTSPLIRVYQGSVGHTGGGYLVYSEPFIVEVELPIERDENGDEIYKEDIDVTFTESDETKQTLNMPLLQGTQRTFRSAEAIDPRNGGGTKLIDLRLDIDGFETQGHREKVTISYGGVSAEYIFLASNLHKLAHSRAERWRMRADYLEALIGRNGLTEVEFAELTDPDVSEERKELLRRMQLHPDQIKNMRGQIIYLRAAANKVDGLLTEAEDIEKSSLFVGGADDKRLEAAAWAQSLYADPNGDYRHIADNPGLVKGQFNNLLGYQVPNQMRALRGRNAAVYGRNVAATNMQGIISMLPPVDRFIKLSTIDPNKAPNPDGTWARVSSDEYFRNLADIGLEVIEGKVYARTPEALSELITGYASDGKPRIRRPKNQQDIDQQRPSRPPDDGRPPASGGGSNDGSGGGRPLAPGGADGDSSRPGSNSPSSNRPADSGAASVNQSAPTLGDTTVSRLPAAPIGPNRPTGLPSAGGASPAPQGVPAHFNLKQTHIYQRLRDMGVEHSNAVFQAQTFGHAHLDADVALAGAAFNRNVHPDRLAAELGISRDQAGQLLAEFLAEQGMYKSPEDAMAGVNNYFNRVDYEDGHFVPAHQVEVGGSPPPPSGGSSGATPDTPTLGGDETRPPAHANTPATDGNITQSSAGLPSEAPVTSSGPETVTRPPADASSPATDGDIAQSSAGLPAEAPVTSSSPETVTRPPASGGEAPVGLPDQSGGSSLPELVTQTRTMPEGHDAFVLYDPSNDKTRVRMEILNDVVEVTDINSMALGRGQGPVLLAEALDQSGALLGRNFSFTAINNPPTLDAFTQGVPARDSVLGRTGVRAAELLGIPIKNVRYERYYHNSKLKIIFEVGE